MKLTRYIVIDEYDLKANLLDNLLLFTSIRAAKKHKEKLISQDKQFIEDLQHNDIYVTPTKFHIYKLEQVD